MIYIHTAFCFQGEVAELAEGARLLSVYRGTTSIEGSNPSLSAIFFAVPGGLAELVDCTGLENRHTFTGIWGSNP